MSWYQPEFYLPVMDALIIACGLIVCLFCFIRFGQAFLKFLTEKGCEKVVE